MTIEKFEQKVLKEYIDGDITKIRPSATKGYFILIYKEYSESLVKKEWIKKLIGISKKEGNEYVLDKTKIKKEE